MNGKDEEFKIPRNVRITVQDNNGTKDAEKGLGDLWFQSAAKAAGTRQFHVLLSKKKDKDEITRVHLLTPTAKRDPRDDPRDDPRREDK